MFNRLSPQIYDASTVSRILGVPCECNDPVPKAANEVIVYYGAWNLQTLRMSNIGKRHMWQDQSCYVEGEKAEPGYYRLDLRVTDSNYKNWDEQLAHLCTIDKAWKVTPVTVATTALLVHLAKTGNDLLGSDWCRCAELLSDGDRAVLRVAKGRMHVGGYSDDLRYDRLWLASSRLVAP